MRDFMRMEKYTIVGIDEAGRGPLAGPVAVAGVAAVAATINSKHETRNSKQFQNSKFLRNIRDSKKLSARQREEWEEILRENFECCCVLVGPETIDKLGIQKAVRLGVARVLRKFQRPRGSLRVLLDGLMSAPRRYSQKTIIRGDEKIPLIAAASVIAKTTRDAKMLRLHKKFPQYCFDRHKGYGTKLHYKMIKERGPCPIHRRSYRIIPG